MLRPAQPVRCGRDCAMSCALRACYAPRQCLGRAETMEGCGMRLVLRVAAAAGIVLSESAALRIRWYGAFGEDTIDHGAIRHVEQRSTFFCSDSIVLQILVDSKEIRDPVLPDPGNLSSAADLFSERTPICPLSAQWNNSGVATESLVVNGESGDVATSGSSTAKRQVERNFENGPINAVVTHAIR